MTPNVGSADRLLRIVGGLILIVLPFMTSFAIWENALFKIGAPVVGAVFVVTALIRFCPLYRILGICTTPRTEA